MVKSILLATDFSERSDRALARARLLAKEAGAKLTLAHIVDDDKPSSMAQAEAATAAGILDEQARMLQEMDGLAAATHVRLAAPFAGIVQAAQDHAADLIVIGPHRRRILRDVFIGTTAERTIRTAPCPVLMANATVAGRYRNTLLTTDLSAQSRKALTTYGKLGIAGGAKISILHVFEDAALRLAMGHSIPRSEMDIQNSKAQEKAYRDLFTFTEGLGLDIAMHHVRLDLTSPATEILTAADELESDLLVIGAREKSGVDKLFLGSVAEAVLKTADIDALVLPCK